MSNSFFSTFGKFFFCLVYGGATKLPVLTGQLHLPSTPLQIQRWCFCLLWRWLISRSVHAPILGRPTDTVKHLFKTKDIINTIDKFCRTICSLALLVPPVHKLAHKPTHRTLFARRHGTDKRRAPWHHSAHSIAGSEKFSDTDPIGRTKCCCGNPNRKLFNSCAVSTGTKPIFTHRAHYCTACCSCTIATRR